MGRSVNAAVWRLHRRERWPVTAEPAFLHRRVSARAALALRQLLSASRPRPPVSPLLLAPTRPLLVSQRALSTLREPAVPASAILSAAHSWALLWPPSRA